MSDVAILEDEDLEDLQLNGYQLLQKKTGFRFGTDSVLLSDFVTEIGGHMMDLCTGSGIVPILCIAKNKADKAEGVEIVTTISEMANRSMKFNQIEDRVSIKNENICQIPELYKPYGFDYVTCNPPYIKRQSGMKSPDSNKAMARAEISCTIHDVCRVAAYLLKSKGSFYLIHRAFRLVDIFEALTENKLEPKRMQLVCSSYDRPPSMVLIEAVKDGKRQLNIEPNLMI